MKTQAQMFYEAHRKLADADQHFLDMVNCPENPLTNDDLIKLVEKFPQRWERYSGFIGKLPS